MSDDQKSDKVRIAKPTPEQVRERQSGKLAALMRQRERQRGAGVAPVRQRARAKATPAAAPAPVPPAKSLPVVRPACAHEGRIIAPCSSCKGELRHVRDCEVHGSCTRGDAGKDVDAVCATCPDYRAAGQ